MYIIPLSMTIMIAWDFLKYGKFYFSEKCYLKSLTETNFLHCYHIIPVYDKEDFEIHNEIPHISKHDE